MICFTSLELTGFPGSSVGKDLPIMQETACNIEDLELIPGSEISPGEGNGDPLQYSCLGNSMYRGDWWGSAHGVTRVGRN